MRIPTRLPFDVEALHRLVAPEEVLEGPGEDVVGRRLAVGGRGALVEDKPRFTLTHLERALERALFLPALHELDLQLREADSLIDLLEHSHSTGTRIGCAWDESSGRPAVPPRFPRLPPRTLFGFRLGSDLGSAIGRRALSHAGSAPCARPAPALCRPFRRT